MTRASNFETGFSRVAANTRAMADESLIEEMRAALRHDREHARRPRSDSTPPAATIEPIAVEPDEQPSTDEQSLLWWARLRRCVQRPRG